MPVTVLAMGTQAPPLVAIDVETTGLDPDNDLLLEFGMILLSPDLKVLGVQDGLVKPHMKWDEFEASLDDVVRDMHTKNGLLKDLKEHKQNVDAWESWDDADRSVAEGISETYPDAKPYLVGRNPAFDRAWLERWMPLTAACLHYRSLDVTLISYLEGVAGLKTPTPQVPAHRALADAKDAVASLARAIDRYKE